jgi:hypothetical protein
MFEALKKARLREVAEEFGVDIEEDATKNEIIRALDTDGVTWDMYQKAFPETEPVAEQPKTESAPAPVEKKVVSNQVLMKMTRGNPTYQIRGYTFTRRHPFVLVSSEDANYIIDNVDGFRIASPREAEEYYS